jgi:hypothetical protein
VLWAWLRFITNVGFILFVLSDFVRGLWVYFVSCSLYVHLGTVVVVVDNGTFVDFIYLNFNLVKSHYY